MLPSGPIPPDAGEFVATHAVGTTIQQLRERADIIIVDAPPLLGLGDAMALTSKVDGILLVARLKVLRRQTVNELRRVLENVPASPLGFVITNAETDKGYGYGYGYGYGQSGLSASHRDAGRRRPFGDARPDRRSAADLPVGCHEPALPRGRLRGPRSGDRRGGEHVASQASRTWLLVDLDVPPGGAVPLVRRLREICDGHTIVWGFDPDPPRSSPPSAPERAASCTRRSRGRAPPGAPRRRGR